MVVVTFSRHQVSLSDALQGKFGMLERLQAVLALFALLGSASAENRILWAAEWKPDGTAFVVGGERTLWEFNAETLVRRILVPPTAVQEEHIVTDIAWHPKEGRFALSGYGFDGVFDHSARTWKTLNLDGGRGVTWSPSGDRLALTDAGDGHLRIWNADLQLHADMPRHGDAKGLTGVAWRPDGKELVTIGKYLTWHDEDGTVIRQIWHRPEAKERLCLLLCVTWHPSGDFFALGDYGNETDDPVIQFWSKDGELKKQIDLPDSTEIRKLDWNAEGTLLVSASDALRVWSKSGELQHTYFAADTLWDAQWHPNQGRILTTSGRGGVTLWDLEAGKAKRTPVVLPKPELAQIFEKASVQGTFVLYDPLQDEWVVHDDSRSNQRFQPASTFKIANAIMALETGAVKDVDDVIPYGGTKEYFKSWEQDMHLRDAMKASNVAVFHQVARRMGLKTIREKLRAFNYGNHDPGTTIDTRFWLEGPLAISAREQVAFIRHLTSKELKLTERTHSQITSILEHEVATHYSIHAKTGWVGPQDPQIGWWVGWVTRGEQIYSFALNINIKESSDAPKRLEVGKACLKAFGLVE